MHAGHVYAIDEIYIGNLGEYEKDNIFLQIFIRKSSITNNSLRIKKWKACF